MIEVKPGNPDTFTLKALTSITVTNTGGSAAVYFDGALLNATHTGTKVYGPFKATGKLKIVSTTTSTYYKTTSVRGIGSDPTTPHVLGPVDSLETLNTVFPAINNEGMDSLVGTAPPYIRYVSNGIDWVIASGAVRMPWCVHNIKPSNMARWIAARESAKSGGHPVISMFGDSTFAGAGAGTGGTTALIGAKARNVETKLAQALKKLGVPARGGHFCGNNNVTSAASITYDGTAGTSYSTQLAYTGTAVWSQQTLGVLMLRLNATGEKASWTPTQSFDTITITYVRNAGLATVNIDVDGGASLGTIVGHGATGVLTASFTCAEGTHTVNITNTANAQFYIRSIKCYSSTRGSVDIMTAAHWGGLVADFNGTSNAWSPGNVIGIDGQSLTIVKLMTNDVNGATSLATYQSGMETLIGRIKSAGSDVLLLSADPFNTASYSNGKASTFIANLRDTLAVNFDCPFLDLDGYFGPQTEQRVGYYFDSLHPTEALYAEEADLIAQVLTAI